MKKLHTRRGGFTLIELMIVVAIIGILAAIAIPNFLRFQLKAKSSEGKTNLAAIRTAEESYFAEYNIYVSALPSPAATGKNVKVPFVATGAPGGFAQLGWSPEGHVYFNYSVSTSGNNYTAATLANIDASGAVQTWGYTTNGTLVAKTHSEGTCGVGGLTVKTVGPCDTTSGQSVF